MSRTRDYVNGVPTEILERIFGKLKRQAKKVTLTKVQAGVYVVEPL